MLKQREDLGQALKHLIDQVAVGEVEGAVEALEELVEEALVEPMFLLHPQDQEPHHPDQEQLPHQDQ